MARASSCAAAGTWSPRGVRQVAPGGDRVQGLRDGARLLPTRRNIKRRRSLREAASQAISSSPRATTGRSRAENGETRHVRHAIGRHRRRRPHGPHALSASARRRAVSRSTGALERPSAPGLGQDAGAAGRRLPAPGVVDQRRSAAAAPRTPTRSSIFRRRRRRSS